MDYTQCQQDEESSDCCCRALHLDRSQLKKNWTQQALSMKTDPKWRRLDGRGSTRLLNVFFLDKPSDTIDFIPTSCWHMHDARDKITRFAIHENVSWHDLWCPAYYQAYPSFRTWTMRQGVSDATTSCSCKWVLRWWKGHTELASSIRELRSCDQSSISVPICSRLVVFM